MSMDGIDQKVVIHRELVCEKWELIKEVTL